MEMTNDALMIEYQILQKFRLEWSMMGHRWGYYIVPLCATVIWLTWTFSRENVFVGILISIFLICTWRYMHHYFDDDVKRLYLRLVEIEEELGMMFTRSYLTREMQKSKLFKKKFTENQVVTSDYIRNNQHKRIFGARRLEKWDLVFGIVILLLCVWFVQISLVMSRLSVLVFEIPAIYTFYFYWKDKQD